ncbi:MAG: hypothetical protein NVS9B4_19150 [Candidatus Acidiferrum sp.]
MGSGELRNIARRWLRYTPAIASVVRSLNIARQFHPIADPALALVSERLATSWMGVGIPKNQQQAVEPELAAYRCGEANSTFDALVDILRHNIPQLAGKSLLEIGCSGGYYSEVLGCRGVAVTYQGCDLSPSFINVARRRYPLIQFDVQDATQLSYDPGSFDIVVSGCCLLHIRDHDKAIGEAVRVSRDFVVFHRTPVLHMSGPAFYTKKAYGTEMLEIHFHEQQLVRTFAKHGMHVVDINSHHSLPERLQSDVLFYKTYLFRKVPG